MEFVNERLKFRTKRCKPFMENGNVYIELWGEFYPTEMPVFSFKSKSSFQTELLELSGKNNFNSFPIEFHIPKLSLDFDCISKVEHKKDISIMNGSLILPVENILTLYASKNETLFEIKIPEKE